MSIALGEKLCMEDRDMGASANGRAENGNSSCNLHLLCEIGIKVIV